MIDTLRAHCEPYSEFVRNIGHYADDFTKLSGRRDLDPSSIRAFIQAHNTSVMDNGAACRAVLGAFATYLRVFHNCQIRPSGFFSKSLAIRQGSSTADLFDVFHLVMFQDLKIPEALIDQNPIERDENAA